MFGIKCTFCDTHIGGLFEGNNFGSKNRPLCEKCKINREKAAQSLLCACESGDIVTAKKVIDQVDDINATNKYRDTLLHIASARGDKEIVELLLLKGARVNADGENGNKPLHLAAARGHKDIIELLLSKGANANYPNNSHARETPWTLAYERGYKELAEFLILKSETNMDGDGYTQLHWASQKSPKELAELIILLKGIDINVRNKNGTTPLHVATKYSNIKMVEFLLLKGADVNARDKKGGTPLDWADGNFREAICKLLSLKAAHSESKEKQSMENKSILGVYFGNGCNLSGDDTFPLAKETANMGSQTADRTFVLHEDILNLTTFKTGVHNIAVDKDIVSEVAMVLMMKKYITINEETAKVLRGDLPGGRKWVGVLANEK